MVGQTFNYIYCIVQVAVRVAYGTALAKIGRTCDKVIALDGDTKNSTFALTFKKEHPDRYIECFIAEQNLVGVAVGCATRNRTIPFASTFACFLSRGYDQIRMAGISHSTVNFCGSHVGCSIGKKIKRWNFCFDFFVAVVIPWYSATIRLRRKPSLFVVLAKINRAIVIFLFN